MTTKGPNTKRAGSPVIPTLRYVDARAAIEWLCEAFGFEKKLVVPGDGDVILHAQLQFGTGMVMLGTAGVHGEFDEQVGPTSGSGGVWSIYIVVPDADAAHARAERAGAEIVMPVEDQDYGGRGFGCLDPEGNMWSFGTYDPWHEE